MKTFIYFLATAALMAGSLSAMAEKFLGGVSGSLEEIRCYSTFEGREKNYVTVTKIGRDSDRYVNELQLKGIWYDQTGREHFAFFDVTYVSGDNDNLLIIGESPGHHSLELNIPLNGENGDGGDSTMKIDATPQDFLKFTCDVTRAG